MVFKKKLESRPVSARNRLFQSTAFQTLLVLVLGGILAALIVFEAPTSQRNADDLRGEEAPYDIRVDHPFVVIRENTEGLEQRRDTAEALILPVWDQDQDVLGDVRRRITSAFTTMRRVLVEAAELADRQTPIPEGTGVPLAEGSGQPLNNPPVSVGTALDRFSEADRIRVVAEHETELTLALRFPPATHMREGLARDGFSDEAEELLNQLVTGPLSHPYVHSLAVLRAEAPRGITLRRVRDGRLESEDTVLDFSHFNDENQVEAALNDLALTHAAELGLDRNVAVAIANIASELLSQSINTEVQLDETAERRANARTQIQPETEVRRFDEGQLLVHQGQLIDDDLVELLRLMEDTRNPEQSKRGVFGGIIYVLLVLVGVLTYGIRYVRNFKPSLKDLASMTLVLLLMVILTKAIMMLAQVVIEKNPDFPAEAVLAAIPFAGGAILIRVVLNTEHALIYTIAYSLLVALLMPHQPVFAAYALVGSLAGTGSAEVVTTRMSLFRAGFVVGLVNIGFVIAMALLNDYSLIDTLILAGFALFGGLTVAVFVTALLPVIESIFHYITDIKLLELSNPSHPALHDLLLRAAGSYQHSMMVGSLVEAACRTIGANALLGRVGSYYHDIGKTKNPGYFAENLRDGKNPHDKLKPHMSALIIKSHVKDGVEMAEKRGLPEEIIRFIREHHGTSLIQFFHHRASEQSDGQVDEADFRYPGPKPQSPETAVCMLADGIEAASKAMPASERSQARLQGLVQGMINKAFTDGQLDECDLTLRDLDAIAREFIRILKGIYHQRPEYPGGKKPGASQQMKPVKPPRSTSKMKAVPQAEQKPRNGSGDSTETNGEPPDTQPDSPEEEGPATLKRLGIDSSRAVDSSNRRQ